MSAAITYEHIDVDGRKVFFRQAGSPTAPKLLLLHGFPTSSHMFRDLVPLLAERFHIVAPDLPGFGHSAAPAENTFDALAATIDRFTEVVGFDRFTMYVFDYGAPVGFRLALRHPERITGIVSQNGNAYEEGLSVDGWAQVRTYWEAPTQANRDALRSFLAPGATYFQYTQGVPDPRRVSPDGYSLDDAYLARPGAVDLQLDLLGNYRSNVALYPQFQAYLRTHRPRFLAVWGKNDPFFLPAGAEAYKRDVPDAKVVFLDTGHFALETHATEVAREILSHF